MDIARIEELVNQYGIPVTNDDVIRIVRDVRGVDVSFIVNPPAPNTTSFSGRIQFTTPIASPTVLRDEYVSYRQSRRMSVAQMHTIGGSSHISIYRSSSPRGGVVDYLGTLQARVDVVIRRFLSPRVGEDQVAYPVPIVYDQNTRLDLEPELIGDADHIRIQCHANPDINVRPMWSDNRLRLPVSGERVSRLRADIDTAELVSAGWEIIHAVDDDDGQIPIGARLPYSVDPNGRHLIVLRLSKRASDTHFNPSIIAECMTHIADRWGNTPVTETGDEGGPSEEDAQLARDLMSLTTFAVSANRRIDELTNTLRENRDSLRAREDAIASLLRGIDEQAQELEVLSSGMQERIIEQARSTFTIADRIREMRPIAEASVSSEGSNIWLEFITHHYGMVASGRAPLILPRLKYRVNMMSDSFSRGIQVFHADQPSGRNAETRYMHPHIQASSNWRSRGSVCWGNAGRRPLPEAWARRDWQTLVRLMLGWHTQYNDASPYVRWSYMRRAFDPAPRSGWLMPEDLEDYTAPAVEEEVEEECLCCCRDCNPTGCSAPDCIVRNDVEYDDDEDEPEEDNGEVPGDIPENFRGVGTATLQPDPVVAAAIATVVDLG